MDEYHGPQILKEINTRRGRFRKVSDEELMEMLEG
jgi:hypothetical protein